MSYETENNNLRTNANNYTLGDTMYGTISSPNDVDCYKVYLNAGHVKFNFQVPYGMNYRIKVFKDGELYNTLCKTDDNSTNRTDRSCEGDVAIGQSDYYYICISFNPDNPLYCNSNYSLKVEYTKLTFPLNLNQRYNTWLRYKCAGICAMDISKYYTSKQVYTDKDTMLVDNIIAEMKNGSMFSGNKLNWDNVPGVKFNYDNRNAGMSVSEICVKIDESIKCGQPIMIHYYDTHPYVDDCNTHWVIPFEYTTKDDLTSIKVIDPYTSNATKCVNTDTEWSFKRSQEYNMSGITKFYYGYATSSMK